MMMHLKKAPSFLSQ